MVKKLYSLFFFLILFSSATAKTTTAKTPCDNCYHHSKAAYYSKASALSSGACGYGSVALNYYGGQIAAASPSFFNDGAYCGACFQREKEVVGAVKVKAVRGMDLAIRDIRSSDPYMVVALGDQQFRTRVVKSDCNPEWNQEFTLGVSDPGIPIKITVFDHDTYSKDDEMGEAEIDIKPYWECMELGLKELPIGTAVKKVQPSAHNYLSDESKVVWQGKGKMVQDMILKLHNVESGEVEIQIEWLDVPGARGFSTRHNLDIYY